MPDSRGRMVQRQIVIIVTAAPILYDAVLQDAAGAGVRVKILGRVVKIDAPPVSGCGRALIGGE